jgi:hypothetical protein
VFRRWAGKGTASPVELAGGLITLLVAEFGDRQVRGGGDAAYHGQALAVTGATWTTRLPVNAALFAPAPSRTGKRGRPALKGAKRGRPAGLAVDTAWRECTVCRYGKAATVQVAEVACVWCGSFGNVPGRCVLVREAGSAKRYDLALFTLDVFCGAAGMVGRYASRWSIEPTNAAGKQHMGVGQARDRLPKAVERIVPFGMLVQSLVIVWYAVSGCHPGDVVLRRQAEPWYGAKTEPSFEDMLVKLRKALIAARFSAVHPGQTGPDILRDYALACAAAAA